MTHLSPGDPVALTPELDSEPYEYSHARRMGVVDELLTFQVNQVYPDDPRLRFYEQTRVAKIRTPSGKVVYYNADWLIKL